MILKLSIPGKCFLVGEYFVLESGRAMAVNLAPQFEMQLDSRGSGSCRGIHPESPAGQWFKKNFRAFDKTNLVFRDPHQGKGGLGASSAQFLAVFILEKILRGESPKIRSQEFSAKLLSAYQGLHEGNPGFLPSGADLLSQLAGDLALVNIETKRTENISWPFKDFGFYILRTGHKLQTHQHLAKLENATSFKELSESYLAAENAIMTSNAQGFAAAITEYQNRLQGMNLLSEESNGLLKNLRSCPAVTAAKACGAMGADLLFALFPLAAENEIQNFLEKNKFEIVGSHSTLSAGLNIKAEPNREITKGPWL